MRTIVLVAMLVIVSMPAQALDLEEALGYVGGAVAVYETYRAVTDRPEETPVAPRPTTVVDPDEPLIRVSINPVVVAQLASRFNLAASEEEAGLFVEQMLYTSGPAIGNRLGIVFLERARLQEAIAEQKLAEDPAMNRSTFEPLGQGLGAQAQINVTILRMSVEDKSAGFEASAWTFDVGYQKSQMLVSVWLAVRVVGVGTYVIAPTTISEQQKMVSVETNGEVGGWSFPDIRFEEQEDPVAQALYMLTYRAVEDLLCKVLPLIRQTAMTRDGWVFNPNTGEALGAAKCPSCHREVPAGARFCPRDGTRIGVPQAPTNESNIGAPEGAEEYTP